MRWIRRLAVITALVASPVGSVLIGSAQDGRVERGKYLVEAVARCQECHTPRLADYALDKSQWLKGATLVAVPPAPIADWHQKSPDISSTSPLWQRWGDAGISTFLQTARNPRGGKAGPPMPAYTMTADDAEAIVAYLKTVK